MPKKIWSLPKFFKQRPKHWLPVVTKFNDQKFDDQFFWECSKNNWLLPKKCWSFDGLWFNIHYWSCKLKILVLAKKIWLPIEKHLIVIRFWWLKEVSITTRFKATKSWNFQLFIIIFWIAQRHFDLGWSYSDMAWGYITSWWMLRHGDSPTWWMPYNIFHCTYLQLPTLNTYLHPYYYQSLPTYILMLGNFHPQ